jgi:hypothetical protein
MSYKKYMGGNKMRVSVELNNGLGKITFLAGVEKIEYDKRVEKRGLAVFYNDKFVLNFVTLEDEVEHLQSDSKVKAIDDLGFMLYAAGFTLKIMRYHSSYEKDESSFLKEVELDRDSGYKTMNVYSELHFYSEDGGKFAEAISLAMKYPEEGNNLWSSYPEGCEEVTL